MRAVVALALALAVACSDTPKVALSRGTTPPRFLARASLQDTIGYYGRTATSGPFEATATLMDWAYLLAYARHQGRARFDDAATIDADARRTWERYGGERTSFAIRISMTSDLQLGGQDPLVDLRTWSFRLRDGRGRVARSEDVEPMSPQGRTEVESVPTWGGQIAYERHHYQLQGAVRFQYALARRAGWVSLHAYPPGLDADPLVFLWVLQ